MADSFTPDQIENMNRFFELINSSASPLSEMQREELAAAAAARRTSAEFNQLSQQLNSSLKSSLVSFGRAAASSEQGLTKYSESIGNATGAVGGFLQELGKTGFVVGGLIKAFGYLTEAALKQSDNMLKAYEGLSEIGSVTQDGMYGLREQLNRIGLASGDFERFLNVLRPVSQTLVSFGGSVSNGTDAMVDVLSNFVGEGNELELSLNRIGYTSETIRQGVVDYVMLQTKLGKAQGKTTEQLTNEAHKYLIEMKGLQELTGMTREDQQRARDQLISDARFRRKMSQMGDEGDNLLNMMIEYQKVMGPEAAQGLKDRIINMGTIIGQASAGSAQRNNNEYALILEAAKKGPESFARIMDQIVQNTRKSFKGLETSANIAENGLSDMGFTNDVQLAILEKGTTNFKQYTNSMGNLNKTLQDQGGNQEELYRMEQKARSDRLKADTALAIAGEGIVGLFAKLRMSISSLIDYIAKTIDWMTANSGGIFKPTNLSSLGKTPESGSASDPNSNRVPIRQSGSRSRTGDLSAVGGTGGYSQADEEILNSLNFGGKRAERTGGGKADSALLGMAAKIRDRIPNIIFTALNDVAHHNMVGRERSKHLVGRALDFALDHNPTEEEAKNIIKMLKELGATGIENGYANGRKNGSGGHFHVEVGGASNGGLFSGSESGYPVMLHGKNESVWPEKDITEFMKDVQQASLDQYKQQLMTKLLPNAAGDSSGSSIADAFSAFNNKLDTLISEQRNSNGIQTEILTYTRA